MAPRKASMARTVLPFSAIVNLEELKLALLLNAINPRIGGLLISGPKGTGKTTIVRSLAALLPDISVIKDCVFRCNPGESMELCTACVAKIAKGGKVATDMQQMRVVDLPLSATEDRVVGSLDVERALTEGIAALKPGILAEANQNILYIDEVNLLPDHIVDAILDAAATGVNVVEREGVSVSHPARFIFIGSMNPEEGELRPQLLDRFPLHVAIEHPLTVEERMAIIRLNIAFEQDPDALQKECKDEESKLCKEIVTARQLMPKVQVPELVMEVTARMCSKLQVDGVRPDIVITKAAMAYAALNGQTEVKIDDIEVVAPLALSHRTRQRGILEPPTKEAITAALTESRKKAKADHPRSKDHESGPTEERSKLMKKFRRFHSVDEKHDGERYVGRAPRRKAAGRASYTSFVCFFIVMAASLGYIFLILFPLLHILNFVLGGVVAAGLILLLERVMRRAGRPGSVLPASQAGTRPPGRFDRFRRAKQKGPSESLPTSAATPPKALAKPSRTKGEPSSRRPSSLPSLIQVDKGRPLFQVQDFLRPRYFGRHRAPKWSIRQVWRRAGSARSQKAQDGAMVGAKIPHGSPRNIHLPATIQAAAPHNLPNRESYPALQIRSQDIREKRYRSHSPLTIIFVIDLSVSMLRSIDKLQRSILAFKTCLEGTRDRVGLIVLKDFGATEVQAPTANWTRLVGKLMTLSISGYTPLAAGLRRALETIKREKRRNPGTVPLIVVFSDYLPNIQLATSETLDVGLPNAIADVLHQCHLLANHRIPVISIDHHTEFFRIKKKRHHKIIEGYLLKRAKELNMSSLIEVALLEEKLITFLGYFIAHLTGGRTFLADELVEPTEIIPMIMSVAHRGVW